MTVSFQIIWRLLFHAIWRMMPRTKDGATIRTCWLRCPNLHGKLLWINELQTRSIELESLTEKIETGSPTGKLIFHVFGALAEFERNLIRERTVAGLKAERARGRKGGRPRKLSTRASKTITALLKTAEVSVQEIAKRYGVSRSTLYRNGLA